MWRSARLKVKSCSGPIACGPPTVVHTPPCFTSTVTFAVAASCTFATATAYCEVSTRSCESMSTA